MDAEVGYSVATDGDTVVAGARHDGIGANVARGTVYTFASTGAAARTETAKLTASDGAAGGQLGTSVAFDGDTILAGASVASSGDVDKGAVYTFSRSGASARTETGTLSASDGTTGSALGLSAAIDEDTIELIRRLAQHYNDTQIAQILSRQARTTATGLIFTRQRVNALRQDHKIPAGPRPSGGENDDAATMTLGEAQRALGVSGATL